MNREQVKVYMRDFDLDPALLGDLISSGKQHRIFRYGPRHIIKTPRRSLYMKVYGAFDYETIKRDMDVLLRYMPQFCVETEVLRSALDVDDYVIKQVYLGESEFITGVNFPHIRDDFATLVQLNRQIIKDHRLSVDFFRNHGYLQSLRASVSRRKERALLNNLLVVPHDNAYRIQITDINLSELRWHRHKHVSLIQWMIDYTIFQSSRFLIRDLFGVKA
jgi:hypothetical protein